MTDAGEPFARMTALALAGRTGVYDVELGPSGVVDVHVSTSAVAKFVAFPGFANLHAHADRTYTVTNARPQGLKDALAASAAARMMFTMPDVRRRARRFFERSIGHGVTRLRTHTDVDPIVGLKSMEGVLSARQVVHGRLDVDVIAFSTSRNDLAESDSVARLRDALAMKPDYIGASLNASSAPALALERVLNLSEEYGLPVDLHLDEHLDASASLTGRVVDAARARGLADRITISHGCALSVLDEHECARLVNAIVQAGVTLIALPETNLFLQVGRPGTPKLRGVTMAREVAATGGKVRLGTDNVRDWFFPFGDGDMLDTGLFAALTLHLDDQAALTAALCDGNAGVQPGTRDIVLVPASSFDDALARRPDQRRVYRAGRLVSEEPV
ncbi:MAG: cytosine deaminase [Hyphomicrobiales bacterium]|nr:cytosine deaminase [Hyphomicrobiales bacterium]